MSLSINDKLSHANSEDYKTEHAHFKWTVDFEHEVVKGYVTFTFKNISKNKSKLKLDSRCLNIEEVTVEGAKVHFELIEDSVDILGHCLSIPIDSIAPEIIVIVKYCTTAKGGALQWMKPEATKGKQHPYLFSQCQAIHARSLFPCQDTPSVKFTYSAEVTAVGNLNVLMSAVKNDRITEDHGFKVHCFEQKIVIPSYLVAIVCGNLEGRKIGPRSTVWSEPEMVDAASIEFSDTDEFIRTGEELCGPYVWGVYDVLVLPPSFPYGGMENPCLTFVTPTLLVGDKSLVYVIAHEISHSWTGNLVTNKTWDDFWLNEGHTMYLEYLIMERHYRSEPMRNLFIKMGLAELKDALEFYGEGHPFNALVPELVSCDPDDAWSIVPYEKGQNVLFHLESVCGKDKMLRWLKEYLKKFQRLSITTEQWKTFFYEYMTEVEHVDRSVLDKVDWQEWFYGRGDIPVQPKLNTELADKCTKLALDWKDGWHHDMKDKLIKSYEAMSSLQKYYMLQVLNNVMEVVLSPEKLEAMCQWYNFSTTTNSEILKDWSLLCIRGKYLPAVDQILSFLNGQGRLRYNKPVYKALYNWTEMRQRAIDNFLAIRAQLHPTTAKMVSHILHLDK